MAKYRPPKVTERAYWPEILKRLAQMAEDDVSPSAAAMSISWEFKVANTTVYNTMQRGEVPSYPSTDRKRARAWSDGHARYLRGEHCVKCEERVFYTSDGGCVGCNAEWMREDWKKHQELLRLGIQTGDYYTGRGWGDGDKVFFEPSTEIEPFKATGRLFTMAFGMLEGATLDELALLTGWVPQDVMSTFYTYLKPKGYGLARRNGRFYILLPPGEKSLPTYS